MKIITIGLFSVCLAFSQIARSKSDVDDIPGLGLTKDTALRDDTIALWESMQRAIVVRDCMQKNGFDWFVAEVIYPSGAALDIAMRIGAQPENSSNVYLMDLSDVNSIMIETLDDFTKNRFFLTLYGESTEELESVLVKGKSRSKDKQKNYEFASGGCTGISQSTIPSIWDESKGLKQEYRKLRQEAIIIDDEKAKSCLDVSENELGACELQIVKKKDFNTDDFKVKNSEKIKSLKTKYYNLYRKILNDDEFHDFLSQAIYMGYHSHEITEAEDKDN